MLLLSVPQVRSSGQYTYGAESPRLRELVENAPEQQDTHFHCLMKLFASRHSGWGKYLPSACQTAGDTRQHDQGRATPQEDSRAWVQGTGFRVAFRV